MGLGKTRTIIAFLYGILSNVVIKSKLKRILILCPQNVIEHWLDELEASEWTNYFALVSGAIKLPEIHGKRETLQDIRYLKVKQWYENQDDIKIMIVSVHKIT